MSSPSLPPTSTYLDFQGLASLRGEAARSPDKAVRQTAEQFEAYFIQQMLKTMRDSIEKSELLEQGTMDMYQDLMDKEVSLQMVRRGGVGLADMLEKQMLQLQAQLQADAQKAQQPRALNNTATMMPLRPEAAGLPLNPPAPSPLPLQRTGAMELQRRSGGQP